MGVWGNHSPTMYPNLFHAEVGGEQASARVDDQAWIESSFLPDVGKRGAAIIEARTPYLEAAFEVVRADYGSAEAFAERALGLDAPARERLKADLLT